MNVAAAAYSPVPICAKIGPGQAPVIAQPIPKIIPPITVPLFRGLPEKSKFSLVRLFIPKLFKIAIEIIPVITAEPIIKYIYGSSNRNIFCILNQLITSDLVKMNPNVVPNIIDANLFIVFYYIFKAFEQLTNCHSERSEESQ